MGTLKLKIKKTVLKRKVEGATLTGYYGRVITNGTKTYDDVLKESVHGSTMDYREARLAGEMMLDGIVNAIKQGYIVDLGPLGKLYPAVNGTWKQNADDLNLNEMKPKVNFKPSDDVAGAVKAASLAWTNEEATSSTSVDDSDEQTSTGGGSETTEVTDNTEGTGTGTGEGNNNPETTADGDLLGN